MESKVVFEGRTYTRSKDGYYRTVYEYPTRYLHRDIWESIHGLLPEGYIVHHIDENRDNNNPENLQKMSLGEHSVLHWGIRKGNPLEIVCAFCGKTFQATQPTAVYCSSQCNLEAYRAAHKDEIKEWGIAYARMYRATHKDELIAKRKAHYATHKDELRRKNNAYCASHKERINARRREKYRAKGGTTT